MNNIYLGEFCEKTGDELHKINKKEYEVIIGLDTLKMSNNVNKILKKLELSKKAYPYLFTDEGIYPYTINDGGVTIGYAHFISKTEFETDKYEKEIT